MLECIYSECTQIPILNSKYCLRHTCKYCNNKVYRNNEYCLNHLCKYCFKGINNSSLICTKCWLINIYLNEKSNYFNKIPNELIEIILNKSKEKK